MFNAKQVGILAFVTNAMPVMLVLLAALSGCGARVSHDTIQPTALCGAPSRWHFQGVHTLMMATPEVSPAEVNALHDGCAIISFGLDDAGKMIAPTLELERPPGSGIGKIAVTVLARNTYAPNNDFGDPIKAQPKDRFAVAIGFVHAGGHIAAAFRTPYASNPLAPDRIFPSAE
jgi:hypothetical protein